MRPVLRALPRRVPTTGALTGEPCSFDEDCRSQLCVERADDMGNPTGYVDGMCVAYCILPGGWNTNTIYAGTALPAAGCAGDAVCFPASFQHASEGDLGVCLPACVDDADCREGYQCVRAFPTASGSTASFDNGICQPTDCARAPCPSGYGCRRVTYADGTSRNLCTAD